MPATHGPRRPDTPGRDGFLTTRWSVVLAAGRMDEPEAGEALERLAESYWFPLYAYARRRGLDRDGARDLVQGFFARLLERRDLASVAPEKGRFRAFLLVGLRNHLVNERERERAEKRGGGRTPVSIDDADAATRYGLELADELTPERQFEKAWARSVLEEALERLRRDYEARGKGKLFAALKTHLIAGDGPSHAEVAAELGLKEGAVKVAVHRLRKRFGASLRAEIADTVADPEDVEDEIRFLFRALSG
ncbi:MAG: sigma-70 family RNA polymerase sigma factor [Proteobacteria bacterium]|nr:sigma-70 family RNA polymerase sigma factor [Pseudomonadota bacterium]